MQVGQVVEDDRARQAEHLALALEEGLLEGLAMLPEPVADAAQLLQRGRLGTVQFEQFPSLAGVRQPVVRGVLAAGLQHAGVAVAEAAAVQGVRQAEPLEGVQGQVLAADRAAAAVLEGVEVRVG